MTEISVSAKEDRPLWGIALMLVAYLIFSFIDTGSKWLAVFSFPVLQLAFMRYFGHFIVSLGINARQGFGALKCPNMMLVSIRGALLMLSTILNFASIQYLPLSLTGTILFSAPIIICALSWPLLQERVGPARMAAIILGFIGIVIAIRPFDDSFHPAVIMSLAGAFCFALYSILTRKLAGQVSSDVMQFYAGAIGTFVLLPFALTDWHNPTTILQWVVLFGLGFLGWSGHQLLTNAMRYAPASLLTPFGYSFVIYLMLWGFLLFDDIPDIWTLLGAVIIVIAGMIIWMRERQLFAARQATHNVAQTGSKA